MPVVVVIVQVDQSAAVVPDAVTSTKSPYTPGIGGATGPAPDE